MHWIRQLILFLAATQIIHIPNVAAQDEALDSRTLIGQLTPVTGETAVTNLYIPFELSSARLSSDAIRQLDHLGEALTSPELSGLQIELRGHTDASGRARDNLQLSDKRAKAVLRYLLTMFDITPNRISARGYGEERLLNSLMPNASENRRVEVVTTRPIKETETAYDGVQAIQ